MAPKCPRRRDLNLAPICEYISVAVIVGSLKNVAPGGPISPPHQLGGRGQVTASDTLHTDLCNIATYHIVHRYQVCVVDVGGTYIVRDD